MSVETMRRQIFVIFSVAAASCGRFGFDATQNSASEADGSSSPQVTNGLVAQYFVSGSGLDDEFGDGPTGTCSPCPTAITTPEGIAFDFSGSSHVELVDDGRFDGSGSFSVTVWVRPIATTGVTYVTKLYGVIELNSWKLAMQPQLEFESTDGSLVRDLETGQDLPSARWSHLAATWDGAAKRIFVDSREVAPSVSQMVAFDRSRIVIGADIDRAAPKEHYDGLLRDFRVYRRALTEEQIQLLAGAP